MALFLLIAILLLLFIVLRFRYPRPARDYRHLRPADVCVVHAVSDVMFPDGGAVAVSGRTADITGYIDRYLGWHAPSLRFLVRLMFALIEHAPLLFVPTLKRFSDLPAEAQERYLAGWEHSRFYPRRMVFQSLRALMSMAYLASPDVERAIGVERPERCEAAAIVKRSAT